MKKIITIICLSFLTFGAFALPNLLTKEEFSANTLKNLSINLSSENITIKESYDESNLVVEIYCNYKKYAPEVSVSGSTLYIDSTKKNIRFFSDPTGLSCTVIIYVPQKKDFDEISIKLSSGDLEIERFLSAKTEIKISASSGDITSEQGLFADAINVSTSSGEIDLFNIDADDFKVNSTSGDIQIKKFTGGTGNIYCTSGDIQINEFASEYAQFKSTSGSISVRKFDCDYFDANNTSGGVSLELENEPTAASSISCSSGDIELYIPMRAKFSVDVSCSSGTFRDKFNNNRMNPREGYMMDYNGGGPTIKLRTSSGDITLEY